MMINHILAHATKQFAVIFLFVTFGVYFILFTYLCVEEVARWNSLVILLLVTIVAEHTNANSSNSTESKSLAAQRSAVDTSDLENNTIIVDSTRSPNNSNELDKSLKTPTNEKWQCPQIPNTKSLECGCEIPHTLRCSGDVHGLEILADSLRISPYKVSLLDCTLKNVTFLSNARIFENVTLQGVVISSGEIKRIHKLAFAGLNSQLQALGLPSNGLDNIPRNSISYLTSLERLDLSNNQIKTITASDLASLENLTYLELSENEISSIALKAFSSLEKLEVLKLADNRLGEYPANLLAIGLSYNLRDLDLQSNSITGSLTSKFLAKLTKLEALNLNRNLIKSIENKGLQGFPRLKSMSLSHNQIDVLQDHVFYGLTKLEFLDLSYNGIVAVSSASLQHLISLRTLDLKHNFLRALTSDLILPLPSLQQLRLGGNDISIIAENALENASELTSLSLDENPLSCDCSMSYFLKWLQKSKLSAQDLLTTICATPPHLEGAPLVQVSAELLTCSLGDIEDYREHSVDQVGRGSHRSNNLTNIRDLSDKIFLTDFHFSTDYGLILTWTVNLKDDYVCDAIFVYKEESIHEILVDDSTIHCESKVLHGKNTVSVIVPGSSTLLLGESYRFCLVLVHQKKQQSELEVGCSNIIKLQTDDENKPSPQVHVVGRKTKVLPSIPSVEEGTSRSSDILESTYTSESPTGRSKAMVADNPPYELYGTLNNSFLPGLGLGILIAIVVVMLWGATRIRNNLRCTPVVATCYTANRVGPVADPERGSRYVKLQATTSL